MSDYVRILLRISAMLACGGALYYIVATVNGY